MVWRDVCCYLWQVCCRPPSALTSCPSWALATSRIPGWSQMGSTYELETSPQPLDSCPGGTSHTVIYLVKLSILTCSRQPIPSSANPAGHPSRAHQQQTRNQPKWQNRDLYKRKCWRLRIAKGRMKPRADDNSEDQWEIATWDLLRHRNCDGDV